MFGGQAIEVEGAWGDDGRENGNDARWREVDRQLRAIARRRAALDAEEATCLREAERLGYWRELGHGSLLEYLEHVFGYTAHVAHERLRVARVMEEVPELAEALASGELPYSAVRELSRVATRRTAAAWREAARGKTVREIEDLVAGRERGDLPSDPVHPDLRPRLVRFEILPETYARLREVRRALAEERGHRLEDDELVNALCDGALAPASGRAGVEVIAAAKEGEVSDPTREGEVPDDIRAKFQIARISRCDACGQGWQQAAGQTVAIGAAALERATCHAIEIGALDGAVAERATRTVPPRIERLVWHRDEGRCRVPGCRAARYLEIHHIVHREDGGTHDPWNLVLLCGAHHVAHHRGLLRITGRAPDQLAFERSHGGATPSADPSHVGATPGADPSHVGPDGETTSGAGASADVKVTHAAANAPAASARQPRSAASRLEIATRRVDARAALIQLGWKAKAATAAVELAMASLGADAPLEKILFEALRSCSPPRP